jgi:hypothetical protein
MAAGLIGRPVHGPPFRKRCAIAVPAHAFCIATCRQNRSCHGNLFLPGPPMWQRTQSQQKQWITHLIKADSYQVA